jgi:hypothetical protein
MNTKEHLWSRIKALQLYETANIFVMVFNADDRDSFDKLEQISRDFKDNNKTNAYVILCSIITNDIIFKRTTKDIKKQEAQDFIERNGIPSYIEVRMDSKKNFNLLDKHLRYIMLPYVDNSKHASNNGLFIYTKLFEVICLKYERRGHYLGVEEDDDEGHRNSLGPKPHTNTSKVRDLSGKTRNKVKPNHDVSPNRFTKSPITRPHAQQVTTGNVAKHRPGEKTKGQRSSDFFSDVFDSTMRSSNENLIPMQKQTYDNPLESITEAPHIGNSAKFAKAVKDHHTPLKFANQNKKRAEPEP